MKNMEPILIANNQSNVMLELNKVVETIDLSNPSRMPVEQNEYVAIVFSLYKSCQFENKFIIFVVHIVNSIGLVDVTIKQIFIYHYLYLPNLSFFQSKETAANRKNRITFEESDCSSFS